MKRLMIAMLSLMLTVPMMAQYGPRTRYRDSFDSSRTGSLFATLGVNF